MQTVERARDAIARNNQTFAERYRSGDADGVAALYTAGGQLFPPNFPPMTGRGEIAGFWRGAMGMGIAVLELVTSEVDQTDGTAVECGNFQLFTADGTVIDHGKYLVAWHLDEGEWRLHRDIWNTSQGA